MLSLLLQAADTFPSAGTTVGDVIGAAKELAPFVAIAIGLYFGIRGRRAQRAGERAKAEADEVKRLFTRKLRLPEYRDTLDKLAANLNGVLIHFPDRQAEVQAEAEATTRLIITTVRHMSEHLDGDHLRTVADSARQIEDRSGVLNLQSGQHIMGCTRDIVWTLTLVIDDERAQSI